MKTINVKDSGCVNPYHPPECDRGSMECFRTLEGLVVLREEEYREMRLALSGFHVRKQP